MKKTVIVLSIFAMTFALLLTGCPQASVGPNIGEPTEPGPEPRPEIDLDTAALQWVTGFEFSLDGTVLTTLSDADANGDGTITDEEQADYDTNYNTYMSIIELEGLKDALLKVFPLWELEGGGSPYNQQYYIETEMLDDIFSFKNYEVTITNLSGEEDTATIKFYLDDRAYDNGDVTGGNFFGECLVIDFDLPTRTPFTNIVFEYTDAYTESTRRFPNMDANDVREAVYRTIIGYETFDYNDPDEDDLNEQSATADGFRAVVFSPDNGQEKVYEREESLINSLKGIDTVGVVNVVSSVEGVEARDAGGAAGGSIDSLIVKIVHRKSYKAVGNFTAIDEIEFAKPGTLNLATNANATESNLKLNTSGTFTGAMVYEVPGGDTGDSIHGGDDTVGTMEISDIKTAVDAVVTATALRGEIPVDNRPTVPANDDEYNFDIQSVIFSEMSYTNQPDGEDSTLERGETLTLIYEVTYVVSGRVDNTVNAAYYAFNTTGDLTKTVQLVVKVVNEVD